MSAVTIVATAGSSTANSYITLADAETAILGYLTDITSGWDSSASTDDIKNRSLVQATRDIDSLNLKGEKYYTGVSGSDTYQALHFPTSTNIYNSSLSIPTEVEIATVLQACYLLRNGAAARATSDMMAAGVANYSASKSSETFTTRTKSRVCPEARAELAKWIDNTISISRG